MKKKSGGILMKWLEIIELRSVDSNRDTLEAQLKRLIIEVKRESKKQAVKVYIRVLLNTDFSIHIIHDSKKIETSGSPLGLHIVSALKEVGLVNHSIWIEMHEKE
jgi:hypothetical protein